MARHGQMRRPSSSQFGIALIITVVAVVIVFLALRAIPSAQRPTLSPPGAANTVTAAP